MLPVFNNQILGFEVTFAEKHDFFSIVWRQQNTKLLPEASIELLEIVICVTKVFTKYEIFNPLQLGLLSKYFCVQDVFKMRLTKNSVNLAWLIYLNQRLTF